MGVLLLGAELFSCFLLTIWLLNKYANWRRLSPMVCGSVFIGWYFSFIIIFVLPLDVSITFYNRCEYQRTNATEPCEKPEGYVPDQVLLRLWRVVYWSAQALCWLILPLLQSYYNAGDFTATARLKSAILNNVIYYGLYLAVFVLILMYAVVKGVRINSEHLKVILISASNTWGLFLLVVLLGYGLVELPRSLWHTGSRSYRLKKTYFDLEKLSGEKNDVEDTLKQLYRESRRILNSVQNDYKLRDLAQEVLAKFPQEIIDEIFPARSATEFSGSADNKYINNPDKYLVAHHKYVIEAVQNYKRTSARWKHLMGKALYLEDVAQAEVTGRIETKSTAEYYWQVVFKGPATKVIAVLMTVMTGLILLSECTFFIVHPTLSPAALIMDYAAQRFHYKYTEFVAIGIIFYLCWCAYFTIFRLKIYRYYHLDPHQNTDENSLIFSAMLMCRLTPPICLNFLGMVHLDSHITLVKDYGVETQFTRLMGHLDVIPILAKGINIYLPICILIFCAITYYKLGTWLLHSIGIDQFIAQDEFTNDMVQAGKSLVQLERNSINRKANKERRDAVAGRNRLSPLQQREDRIPILQQNPDDVETGNLLDDASFNLRIDSQQPRSSPFRDHPTPSNIFDDM